MSTIDDITTTIQNQRDAAWGEVARRLAHEIKNPLTPIQLSAERMRRKYLDSMTEEESRILDRATHTIVQQVEAMKEMVNAFSDYARAPDIELGRFDMDKLVHEVVDLYRAQEREIKIMLTSDPTMPPIEADIGRVRVGDMQGFVKAAFRVAPQYAEAAAGCVDENPVKGLRGEEVGGFGQVLAAGFDPRAAESLATLFDQLEPACVLVQGQDSGTV